MTAYTMTRPVVRRSLALGALLAAVWVIVALIRPSATFHLAPLLVAGAPVALFGLDGPPASDRGSVLLLGAASLVLALVTTLVVDAVGAMNGPALGGFPTPLLEAAVFGVLGSIAGVRFALWRIR